MKRSKPWAWIPSLYFAEGLPYVAVMTVSVIMYKNLGISNTDIAFYTSWLYLPWVIKPLWSPFIDLIKTKRWWVYSMQLLIGGGMAGIAFTIPADFYFQATLAFFWLMAFSSATHDIAADGFYMLGLSEDQQAFFIGIRNTFYRIAMLTGQGLLVMLAGLLEKSTGHIPFAWSIIFFILAGAFVGLSLWHKFILPYPKADAQRKDVTARTILNEFGKTFVSFFRKKGVIPALLFMLTYRLGESQLVKLASPFLLDKHEAGGLQLETAQVGFAYGTVGVISLLLGGILGGIAISKNGLKTWLWPMALAISLPNLVYLYMAYALPDSIVVINACVGIEQFGYGFGFTAYTMYLMLFSDGEYKTSHYALCTGFMALGMMLPGMTSGWIQEMIGYQQFFIWVMICCIPAFLVIPFLKIKKG
ncbi:PAT family beta-lactamase induction signal transducer AmpG [Parabacteroides sp. PF5-5]|uniref:MFS transporter n=1 Tax=unclassified Parabacteroides TaxID=2649774 RepID=UPI0024758615|nr:MULTISPECIES: MFS transporter [unclassified Parabacteroides]MDH6315060.1 PAT family beta-lactamase induction signal transducer AmpG [Parabacteroides sp. PF5-13]MDH6326415.1 PAT family beta-lactamase induction signal transducer AmpG [Parabacteroides sp. PH5-41]MDH6334215.1 PAT family beta-lactamase induction signal transducer AmpG [Parabacteroides sp. PF5-5]MDH6345115.1 PAT family beta-lactamase induction signal transducer AmpG [Parabacteroides sp. PH5-46]MDH6360236.1 PAT family beta-lactama